MRVKIPSNRPFPVCGVFQTVPGATALLEDKTSKTGRSSTEHNAWWMPQEWARERRIGAYGTDWQFEPEVEEMREKELEVAKKPNVEQIRTCNFVRL